LRRWKIVDGRWEMGDGRWEMGDGCWMLDVKAGHHLMAQLALGVGAIR